MKNIVKETLQNQLEILYVEIDRIEKEHHRYLNDRVHRVLECQDINPLFKEFDFGVTDRNITFKIKNGAYYDKFEIKRDQNYGKDANPKYKPAVLSCSSTSEASDSDLKILICVGEIAKLIRSESPIWKDLVRVMDEYLDLKFNDISELSSQCYEIRQQMELNSRNEADQAKKRLFDKGVVEFNKSISFHYGSGRHDNAHSSKFTWVDNGNGKTFTVGYESKRQINYDEASDQFLDIEITKHNIPKRIKLKDLEQFLFYNMNNIKTV